MPKGVDCFSKGHRFSSQLAQGSPQLSLTPVPEDAMTSSGLCDPAFMWCTDIHAGKIPIWIKEKEINLLK